LGHYISTVIEGFPIERGGEDAEDKELEAKQCRGPKAEGQSRLIALSSELSPFITV
jgi:hypothetical protein